MKAKRDRICNAFGKLVEGMGLEKAITSLLWYFDSDAELAAILREGYVASYRMVLTSEGYVDNDKFPFERKVAEVRAQWIAERRDTSARYIESLRKRVEDGAESDRAALESAIKCHELDFPAEQKKAS